MESRNGLMERSTQDVLSMDRRKAEASSNGLEEQNISEILFRGKCKVEFKFHDRSWTVRVA